jgi:predicted Ser/Thr protein kinase
MTAPLTIEPYEIRERLGSGGFGEVYRAYRADLDRDVAIKVLNASHCRDVDAVSRFVAEAKAASQIAHPGIVKIYGFGDLADGRSYCVMELLEGKTLRQLIDERGALPLVEAEPLLRAIAEAIDAAHAAGIAHRDLKPENLFVEPDGSIRVIDFGLAKLSAEEDLTTTGHVIGSPRYMSPEQCRGKGSDARSDLYSFGALAYHLLTGTPPFEGDALALALHHLNDRPEAPSVRRDGLPATVDDVVLALLDKDPDRRPRPLVMVVDRLTTGAPVAAPAPRRRARWPFLIALGAVVSSTAVVVMATRGPRDATTAAPAPGRAPSAVAPLTLIKTIPQTHLDGAVLDSGGEALFFSGEDGSNPRRVLIATGVETPLAATYNGTLGDGREIHVRDGMLIAIDRAGAEEKLVAGGFARVAEDGHTLAFIDGGWLQTYDVRTHQAKRVVAADSTGSIVRWSPLGTKVVWESAARRVQITRISDGTTTEMALPLLAETGGLLAVAFVDEDTIVYCATENDRSTIQVRPLTALGTGTVLRDLGPEASGCMLTGAGRRIAIGVTFGRFEVGALDARSPEPRELVRAMPDPKMSLVGVSDRGDKLVVFDQKLQAFVDFDRATKQRVARPTCPDGRTDTLVRGPDGPVRYEAKDEDLMTRMILFAGCEPAAEWKVPSGTLVSSPTCRGALCSALAYRDKHLRALILERGKPAREVGAIAMPAPQAGWTLDLSPDGRWIVAAGNAAPTLGPYVFSTTGAAARTIKIDGIAQAAVWGAEPDRFVVSGMSFPGALYALASVGLDGSVRLLWKSTDTWLYAAHRDATGERHRRADEADARRNPAVRAQRGRPGAVITRGVARAT